MLSLAAGFPDFSPLRMAHNLTEAMSDKGLSIDSTGATTPKILVLVDRFVKQTGRRARTSLWQQVLPQDSFVEVSIADAKSGREPVQINLARLVIVNWDAANGDFITGSDDTLTYFVTRKDRRDALLRDGGKLLCEYQSGRGKLHQGAYDAIFGQGELVVVDANMPNNISANANAAEEQWNNARALVVQSYCEFHPLLHSLGTAVTSRHNGSKEPPLFGFDPSRTQESFYAYKYRTSIYNCWFEGWKKDWVPLLVADLRKPWPFWKKWFTPPPAVLLAKYCDGGLMIASTMWIAGSKCSELVDVILGVFPEDVRKAHRRIRSVRMIEDLFAGAMIAGIVYHYSVILKSVFTDLGYFWTVLILFRLWLHLIWRRPFGVSVAQGAKAGFRAFWETI